MSLVVVALALGLGAAFGFHLLTDPVTATQPSPTNVRGALARALANEGPAESIDAVTAPVDVVPGAEPPSAAAADPNEAVHRFLQLEVARDYDASYGLLSAPDRLELTSRAAWTTEHADLPAITGYEVGSIQTHGDRADVAVNLRLRAELTPGDGLVPARATATFATVAEDGGWRVAFADSSIAPQFPSDARAPAAVQSWVRARVQCRTGLQYRGGLIGAPPSSGALCGAEGPIRTDRPRKLPETAQDQPFLAAFGSAVHDWARVVRVEAPVRLDVVVAPLGEHWLVVGVLQAPSESS